MRKSERRRREREREREEGKEREKEEGNEKVERYLSYLYFTWVKTLVADNELNRYMYVFTYPTSHTLHKNIDGQSQWFL